MPRVLRGVGLAVVLLSSGIAQADQGRITWLTIEARRLAELEGAAGIPAAFGTFRAWIAEAQAYQVAKDDRRLARALARVEAQHQLIVALLDKVVSVRAASEAKAEAEEARAAATQAHVNTARREDHRRRVALSVEVDQ
ncbi:MAG: hypothetical protein ACI9U2_001850 [Bradymonadia bacterium]|jgi:hypothetical protein